MIKKETKKKITKEEAEERLKRAGILTKRGNVAKPYKEIWSYLTQA